jgi:hypothetical protein
MSWIILLDSCYISGEPFEASPEPIKVSSVDAKLLISQRLAVPAEAPQPAPSCPPSKPRSSKPAEQ